MTDDETKQDASRLDLLTQHGRDRRAIHLAPGQFVRMFDGERPIVVRLFRWDEGTDLPTGRHTVRIFGYDADLPVGDDSPVTWTEIPADEPVLSLSARDAKRVGLSAAVATTGSDAR